MGNTFKTALLLTSLTLLLMLIGRAFGGQNGMLLALAFAAVMNFPAAGSKFAHLKSRSRGGVANS